MHIGNFRILRILGEGGMGRVWLGEQMHLGYPVVVKSLHPHYAQEERLRARFFQEARLLQKLHHPAIVRLYDFIIQEGTPYLIMEYVQGQSLEQYLAQKGSLSVEETLTFLQPIFEALSYLHQQNIIHRDLKPANILLLPEGGAKLIDFGIAKALEEDLKLTQTGMQVGTVLYMAPEQIQGKPISPQTDLYAMGLIVYECLFGQFPWEWRGLSALELYQKLLNETPPLPQWAPENWKAFFRKALEKNAEARYPSAQEMGNALAQLLPNSKSPVLTGSNKEKTQHSALSPPTSLPDALPSPLPKAPSIPSPNPPEAREPPEPTPRSTHFPLPKKPSLLLTLLIGVAGTIGAIFFLLSALEDKETTSSLSKKKKNLEDTVLSAEIQKALLRKLQNIARSSADKIQWAELPTYKTYLLEDTVSIGFTRYFSQTESDFEEIAEPCYLSGVPIGRPKGKRKIRIEYEVQLACTQQGKAFLTYRYDRRSHSFTVFELRWPQEGTPPCKEEYKMEVSREVSDCKPDY